MCGRFNVSDSPKVQALLNQLGVDSTSWPIRYSDTHFATNTISIVREINGQRVVVDATWWLLLDACENGFKPSRCTSFNTRYDKLDVPRSAGYRAYRDSRCIIIASGFGETEYTYQGKRKIPKFYHNFEAIDSAIAFGGLCREWKTKEGEVHLSCSIITNPPHRKLTPYHSKASPLMLPQTGSWLDTWLDRTFNDTKLWFCRKIWN